VASLCATLDRLDHPAQRVVMIVADLHQTGHSRQVATVPLAPGSISVTDTLYCRLLAPTSEGGCFETGWCWLVDLLRPYGPGCGGCTRTTVRTKRWIHYGNDEHLHAFG
jgi:hypothetical protein